LQDNGTHADSQIRELINEVNKITGLNTRESPLRIDRDMKTWIETVKSFVDSMPELLEILMNTSSDDLDKYSITVHGIKSVCFSFGAQEAGAMAKDLEDRSGAGDKAFVTENHENFIKAIAKLIQDLANLLAKFATEENRPVKDKPDSETIAKILEAATHYDIRKLDNTIALLEEYTYTEDAGLVPWLRKQCDNLEFSAIQERLQKQEK
jgi:HPt (histidine-containing phosphotransfer) domain-containing protein